MKTSGPAFVRRILFKLATFSPNLIFFLPDSAFERLVSSHVCVSHSVVTGNGMPDRPSHCLSKVEAVGRHEGALLGRLPLACPAVRGLRPNSHAAVRALFYFLYLKKSKFQKYMSVLKYFKNTPGRSLIGRQALSVIFFLQICNEVPGQKK